MLGSITAIIIHASTEAEVHFLMGGIPAGEYIIISDEGEARATANDRIPNGSVPGALV